MASPYKLNLRSSPAIAPGNVIATLPIGTVGTVTGFPQFSGGNTWYPVTMPGFGSGWVAGQYLVPVSQSPTPTRTPTVALTPTATRTVVTASTATPTTIPGGFSPGTDVIVSPYRLNLRSSPEIASGNVIAVMPIGTTGTVTGFPQIAGGYTWYPVTMDGFGSGWVAGNYLVRD
jgi:hypothetical protein